VDERKSWIGPVLGILFVGLAVVSVAISGEPPDPGDDSAQEIVDFYVDNDSQIRIAGLLQAVAASALVFFTGFLRPLLSGALGPDWLPRVMFAGSVVFAVGVGLDATINFALVELADDIDPIAVQSLSALWNNDYLVWAIGVQLFCLGLGIAIVRDRALPVWLGWVAILLGVVAVSPAGFVSFIGMFVLVLVLSVILLVRRRPATA
jgi:hypothetical protein